ncbi:unnamed protein product [Ilex paraguariensis]|uniref:Bifunctional inhibitor/plant lipid transfer protein/seed storage helical domain-containing protein n=1 Tax=Ilex paraguariensis TaxID=185542 RepID=A0ABC8TTI8_9AQUA
MVCSKMTASIMAVVVLAVASIGIVRGQSTQTCASKLVPCVDYLNSTNPPPSCCGPLADTVKNDLQCLCNLYETPGLLAQLGINITKALALTGHCGIPGDLSACNAAAPTSSSVPHPPGVPGNNGNRMAWTGMSGLLLLCASAVLY